MSTNKADMNKGVQMLAARMESNPEEFAISDGKWASILTHIIKCLDSKEVDSKVGKHFNFLTDDELDYLVEKLKDARRENFTANVINTLMQDQKELFGTNKENFLTPAEITNLRNQLIEQVQIRKGDAIEDNYR